MLGTRSNSYTLAGDDSDGCQSPLEKERKLAESFLVKTGGNSSRYRAIYGNYAPKSVKDAAEKIPS